MKNPLASFAAFHDDVSMAVYDFLLEHRPDQALEYRAWGLVCTFDVLYGMTFIFPLFRKLQFGLAAAIFGVAVAAYTIGSERRLHRRVSSWRSEFDGRPQACADWRRRWRRWASYYAAGSLIVLVALCVFVRKKHG
jgi:hypothetical protein